VAVASEGLALGRPAEILLPPELLGSDHGARMQLAFGGAVCTGADMSALG